MNAGVGEGFESVYIVFESVSQWFGWGFPNGFSAFVDFEEKKTTVCTFHSSESFDSSDFNVERSHPVLESVHCLSDEETAVVVRSSQ